MRSEVRELQSSSEPKVQALLCNHSEQDPVVCLIGERPGLTIKRGAHEGEVMMT